MRSHWDSAPAAVWHHERRTNRRLEEVREEFSKLMLEQVESLRAQTFGVLSEEEGRLQDDRLKRIRTLSADFLMMLKNEPI